MEEYLDNELDEDDVIGVDEAVYQLITDEEMELSSSDEFSDDVLLASIRRLYLAGKIKKRKVGKQVFYRRADVNEHNNDDDDDDEGGLENETKIDRKNVSRMARKFRSCRYKVIRGYIAPNGVGYSLSVTKKDVTYLISYISNVDYWTPEIFSKMLENDKGIRIVVSDNKMKLSVAKIFDEFVRDMYGGSNGLLSFNQEHSFRIITIDQFAQGRTWKTLVK